MQPVLVSGFRPSGLVGNLDQRRRRATGVPALDVTIGDITREASDAIVNPVGPGLCDLAIRRSAGPALLDAFHGAAARLPGGKLGPGQALVTPGFDLQARHVIHCGPPVYADDPEQARADLAACHIEALRLARNHGFTSISFPAIGTGIYRYPIAEAAAIAVDAVTAELRAHPTPLLVRFVLFTAAAQSCYAAAAARRD